MPAKETAKEKKEKKTKGFRYYKSKHDRGNANTHYSYLNFLQQQAHSQQVNSLVQQLTSAQNHTKRAVKAALDAIYDRSGPMDIDPRQRHPRAPPPPTNISMARANPFDSNPTLTFGQEIRRLAAQNNLMRRNRVARETPTSMEDMRATLNHNAPPAVAQAAFTFMSQGLNQSARHVHRDGDGFNARMNELRRNHPTTSIPTRQQQLEHRTAADAAATSHPPINHHILGRDFKAPRILPGIQNGTLPSSSSRAYFRDRLGESYVHKPTT